VKPQIEGERLDGGGCPPHIGQMAWQDETPKATLEVREAKLAQALRANLRRRKAQAPPKVSEAPAERDA
jgi:hypothetical protein